MQYLYMVLMPLPTGHPTPLAAAVSVLTNPKSSWSLGSQKRGPSEINQPKIVSPHVARFTKYCQSERHPTPAVDRSRNCVQGHSTTFPDAATRQIRQSVSSHSHHRSTARRLLAECYNPHTQLGYRPASKIRRVKFRRSPGAVRACLP